MTTYEAFLSIFPGLIGLDFLIGQLVEAGRWKRDGLAGK